MPFFVDVVRGSIAVADDLGVGVQQERCLQLSAVRVFVAVEDVQGSGDACLLPVSSIRKGDMGENVVPAMLAHDQQLGTPTGLGTAPAFAVCSDCLAAIQPADHDWVDIIKLSA